MALWFRETSGVRRFPEKILPLRYAGPGVSYLYQQRMPLWTAAAGTPLGRGVAPRLARVAVGSHSAAGGGALHSGPPLRQCPTPQEIACDVEAWDMHFEKSP